LPSFTLRKAKRRYDPAMSPRIAFAVLLLLPFAAPVGAEVHEALDYDHYDAQAQRGRTLAQAVNEASPFRPDGQVFHSATAWYLDWQVQPQPTSDGRCGVGQVLVSLHGQMTLPRLVGGTARQQQHFEQYLSRLREHELGHYEIGREAARELEKEFYALPPARNCAELQTQAREEGARLLPKYEAMGNAYDEQTQHGKTQGAWLTY
jgi:predicted secreted Zn-dependent protease